MRLYIKVVFALLFVAVASIAVAQTHPIDFTTQLNGIDGTALVGPDSKPLTLGSVAVQALQLQLQEDAKLTGEQKFEMDALARKIYKNASCTLTVEEIVKLKTRIGAAYGPAVVGATWRVLDPNVTQPDVKPAVADKPQK